MAAFALSFNDLTRDNIRHIYSDRTAPIFVPQPRPFGKSSQFLDVPLVRRFPPRFFDYYPAFNVGLPRAPAFNQMTLTEIRQMLQRLERPIACQTVWQHHPQATAAAVAEDGRNRRKIRKVVRFRSPVHDDAFGLEPATRRQGQGHQGQSEGFAQGGGDTSARGAKAEGQSENEVKVGTPVEKPDSNLLPNLTETKKKPAAATTSVDGKVATSEEVERRVKDAAEVRAEDTASKPGAGEVGKRKKKKWSSKREKVVTTFSRLSLLPPITKSHGK